MKYILTVTQREFNTVPAVRDAVQGLPYQYDDDRWDVTVLVCDSDPKLSLLLLAGWRVWWRLA